MALAPEVAGAIVGGAIGIVSATVTALANYATLKKRLKAKNRRQLADSFLEKKVDVLSTLHTKLTDCYVTIGTALQSPAEYSWDRVRSEVHAEIDAFENAITASDVYLTASQEATLRATVDDYRQAADKIAILENGRRDMIEDVYEGTEQASATLAEEINKPIRRIEGAGDGDATDEEATAERRNVPGDDGSNWAALATQRDRLREYLDVTDDGDVEIQVAVDPYGRAMFGIVGRRYAYERDLVESPTVDTSALRALLEETDSGPESFAEDAGDTLVHDDGEYFVEAEDIEAAIDWATTYLVESDGDGQPAADGEPATDEYTTDEPDSDQSTSTGGD